MACTDCKDTPRVIDFNITQDSNCAKPCQSGKQIDSSCVVYDAPSLQCSGINNKDSVEVAIQKIDSKLCAVAGDYSSYNTNCLKAITDEASFVAAITKKVCENSSNISTLSLITIPSVKNSLENQIKVLDTPSLAYQSIGVVASDNIKAVLSKYGQNISAINTNLSLAGVDWNKCVSNSTIPTNLSEAFNNVISQICSKGGGEQTLTFDNTSSCLPGTNTSSDSLYDTVNKIKSRLCSTPVFTINGISFGSCFSPTTDLQSTVQSLITKSNSYTQNQINSTDSFLKLTPIDPTNPCLGKRLSVSSDFANNKVGATTTDTTPGSLQEKLVEGGNISLDYITTPGKVIISSDGGGDGKVLASSADTTAGFLVDKIVAGGNAYGIGLDFQYDVSTKKVVVTPRVDLSNLFSALIDQLSLDSDLKSKLCTAISSCPAPCPSPTNVQVTQVS